MQENHLHVDGLMDGWMDGWMAHSEKNGNTYGVELGKRLCQGELLTNSLFQYNLQSVLQAKKVNCLTLILS